jgi:hopanoid biosynthesis associated protein HpnK
MRKLIVTGDDFGLAVPVNEAIEAAHRDGILTAASLMVGAEAAADAVERARRLPSLKVGLHLVVVEGRPALPPDSLPDLVNADGRLPGGLVWAGVRFVFNPRARRQLEAEIRAQFEAFRRTGLALDHVNAHNHMHLHPTVLSLLLKVGRDYGLKAVRLPYEPLHPSWQASAHGRGGKLATWLLFAPWVALLRGRLTRAGVRCNDFVLGLYDSGRMQTELVLRLLAGLPEGVTEMYFHPATRRCPELDRTMPDYHHQGELAALLSPAVRAAVTAAGSQRIGFGDLGNAGKPFQRGKRCSECSSS